MTGHCLLRNAWVIVGCAGLGLACGGDEGGGGGGGGESSLGGTSNNGGGGQAAATEGDFTEADCVAPPNATAEWHGEQLFGVSCEVVCNPGRADCDGQRGNGCETDTSDAAACGRCVDSCLTDMCGGAAACTSYQANVWSLQAAISGGRVRGVAVGAAGQVFVRLNGAELETGAEPLAAVSPGAVVAIAEAGPLWQSLPGDSSLSDDTSTTQTSDSKVVATNAGLYVAELYTAAQIGGQSFDAPPPTDGTIFSRDIMLSLVGNAGERRWSRPFNMPGSPSVFGLFADEDSNAYVQVYTNTNFEYDGRSIEVPSSGGYATFAFDSMGELRWIEEVAPLSVRPASGGIFATAGIFGADLLSADTGERLRSLNPSAVGAEMISVGSDGGMVVAGTIASSDLEVHAGLPGLSGVTVLEGEEGDNQQAVFVQKFGADASLVWETHFASLLRLTLYDLEVTADGTVYVLASGKAGGQLSSEPERVFVARVGPNGQQQGAFRFDAGAPRGADFALAADGTLHVGTNYTGGAVLDQPITGSGIIGADVRFTAF